MSISVAQIGSIFLLCLSIGLRPSPGQVSYTIQTLAGSSLVGDGGSALSAQLNDAEGLGLDRQGNVYIADPANHRIRVVNRAGIIQTLAGTGAPGFSGDGGPAAQAQLNAPYSVAADSAGNLYIADLGNNRVRKVAPDGSISTVAGSGQPGSAGDGGPALAAQLNAPRNLAVDGGGNLYISEFNGHRIRIVGADGAIHTFAGTGLSGVSGNGVPAVSGQLSYPAGIAFDFTGTMYIADSGNSRIEMVFNGSMTTVPLPGYTLSLPTGVATDGVGGIYIADSGNKRIVHRTGPGAIFVAAGSLDSARDVAVDQSSNLYIADAHRVRLISGGGVSATFAGDGTFGFRGDGGPATSAVLSGPSGVALDSFGNMFIADEQNHRLRAISNTGVISTVVGTGLPSGPADGVPASYASLDAPASVVVDSSGTLWIGEYFGNRVVKLYPGGMVQTAAGNGTAGYNGDSRAASSAELMSPSQTAVDAAGNLYIADMGNHRIRKVTPSGMISTFAGTGAAGYSGDGAQAPQAQLNLPRGVAVDAAGYVFIADTNNNCIRKVTPGGLISTVAGGGSASALSLPRGLTVGSDQNLYIADTGNQRIAKLTPGGVLSTVAGTGAAGFGGDGGDALSAQFTTPVGVTMDSAANLYVADFDNNRVRKLTPASTLTGAGAAAIQLPGASVTNAASLITGPVAPGEMVAISGNNIGPASTAVGVFEANGVLDTLLSETQVLFDGRAASMSQAGSNQIVAQVPYEVATQASTHAQVYYRGSLMVDVTLPVAPTAPGIYTVSGGTGQAVALLPDLSPNSLSNPAAAGSSITFFATGEGQTTPAGVDGTSPSSPSYPVPVATVAVQIGGLAANVLSVSEAPNQAGMLQIVAQIPPDVAGGVASLSLTIGATASQGGVTVFVK